ncbi:hypothetical protein MTO96_050728 [Rhipicephalus appendiculatus]
MAPPKRRKVYLDPGSSGRVPKGNQMAPRDFVQSSSSDSYKCRQLLKTRHVTTRVHPRLHLPNTTTYVQTHLLPQKQAVMKTVMMS